MVSRALSLKGLGDANAYSSFNTGNFLASTGGLSNSDFVISLYRQALGRQPSAGEIAGWVGGLNNGGISRFDVINQFVSSSEFFSTAQTQSKGTDSGRLYLESQGGGSGLVPAIISPTPATQVTAANATTASGDTTGTSQSTMSSISNVLSGSVSLGGYDIPTVALIGGALVAYFMFFKKGR